MAKWSSMELSVVIKHFCCSTLGNWKLITLLQPYIRLSENGVGFTACLPGWKAEVHGQGDFPPRGTLILYFHIISDYMTLQALIDGLCWLVDWASHIKKKSRRSSWSLACPCSFFDFASPLRSLLLSCWCAWTRVLENALYAVKLWRSQIFRGNH